LIDTSSYPNLTPIASFSSKARLEERVNQLNVDKQKLIFEHSREKELCFFLFLL